MEIAVHPLSNNPTAAWREISNGQKVYKLNVKIPTKPVSSDKVRFVCMSDTHSLLHNIKFDIPDGDVFIHAGDFTKCGQKSEVEEFNKWIGTLPHKYKLVIGGNHELSFDNYFVESFNAKGISSNDEEIPYYGNKADDISDACKTKNIKQYLSNCIYLQDESFEVYGIKIYGTPWQPAFGNWAFNLPRGKKCLEKWNLIPNNIDILITHTPPVGHGDFACSGVRAGCVDLLMSVQNRIQPKYHIFGHIHEGKTSTLTKYM